MFAAPGIERNFHDLAAIRARDNRRDLRVSIAEGKFLVEGVVFIVGLAHAVDSWCRTGRERRRREISRRSIP